MKRRNKIHHGHYLMLKKFLKEIHKRDFLRADTNNNRRFRGRRPIRDVQIHRALDREYCTKWREK